MTAHLSAEQPSRRNKSLLRPEAPLSKVACPLPGPFLPPGNGIRPISPAARDKNRMWNLPLLDALKPCAGSAQKCTARPLCLPSHPSLLPSFRSTLGTKQLRRWCSQEHPGWFGSFPPTHSLSVLSLLRSYPDAVRLLGLWCIRMALP